MQIFGIARRIRPESIRFRQNGDCLIEGQATLVRWIDAFLAKANRAEIVRIFALRVSVELADLFHVGMDIASRMDHMIESTGFFLVVQYA